MPIVPSRDDSIKTRDGMALQVPSSNGNGKPHDYARLFEKLGVALIRRPGDQAQAEECPFCGKDRFYLNVATGLYDCKKCREKGNVNRFLNWAHDRQLKRTTNDDYARLAAKRGIAWQTLQTHALAYDPDGSRWFIPFKNAKG